MDFTELVRLVERLGLPVVFCGWLALSVTRDIREMKSLLFKMVTLLTVMAKTIDLPPEQYQLTSIPPPKTANEKENTP